MAVPLVDAVEVVMGRTEREGELLVDAEVVEEIVEWVGRTEGEGLEGSSGATLADETAGVSTDEAEAPDCACLACFLAAAFVCHPHVHGLFAEDSKNDPCRHLLIDAIAANTSLLDGFWPLPVNAGRPSARSINCSAYFPTPRKWCDLDISEIVTVSLAPRT